MKSRMFKSVRSSMMGWGTTMVVVLCATMLASFLAVTEVSAGQTAGTNQGDHNDAATGIHKIKHIIIIMQENRSFDTYFGTYPGADGIPTRDGEFTVCVPDPANGNCVKPFHNRSDVNGGGPHGATDAVADVDDGKMDGFIVSAEKAKKHCSYPDNPTCANSTTPDVMGYHDDRDIPNYWQYARNFVLQDHMFEPNASWSLPAHLFEVSEWSASCTKHNDASSCVNALDNPGTIYAWTDLTYLLHRAGVSWGYYVMEGTEPDCDDDSKVDCRPVKQNAQTPSIWNPLPSFDTVKSDGEIGNIQDLEKFLLQAQQGTLPAVSWIAPSGYVSEHPPSPVSAGQTYVTHLINTIMQGPNWKDCAIFLAWDDWGGFYDHVVPVRVDENGYGLRVPGLVISPFAKRGFIDHQTLSFDAFVKFIEDDFLYGQRLDPKTDDRPDPRPTVREEVPQLGDLRQDFNFDQRPRPPLILPEYPATDLLPPSAIGAPSLGLGLGLGLPGNIPPR
jgi:phospholipase C